MSDPDRLRQREHWQAIAEQLGLAPESDEPRTSEPGPSRRPISGEEEPAAEPAIPRAELERTEELPPRRPRRGRSARPEKEPAQEAESKLPAAEQPAITETDTEPAPTAEEQPALQRGRRRRSARALPTAEQQATDAASGLDTASQAEASNPTEEPPKRRGRGRGRPQKAGTGKAAEKPPTTDEAADKGSALEETEEAELEDVRSLSNWNVPSWNELIASLFRPER